jgi:RimJ/RimL family protein N-acetyltransferase
MENALLKTDRLTLRRWRDEDRAPFAAICADPDVMRFIGDGSTQTLEESASAIDRYERQWKDRGFGLFAVELNEVEKLIGFAGLSWPDFLPELLPSIEIGWRIAKPYWGMGYASEAAAEVLSFGVGTLGITDIVSICQLENSASIRIMQKLGMSFDRRTVDPTCNRDVEVYRLPN